ARELVDDLPRVDEVERAHALLHEPGGLLQKLDVALDLAWRVRALHLDGDAPAVRQDGAMHLADRRRCHRLLLELEEQTRDRLVQVLEHHPLHVGVGKRPDVVLKAPELRDDVRRDDVRAGGEQLPELDERGAELVEHLPQVAPPDRRCLRRRRSAPFEHEAEAVAHGRSEEHTSELQSLTNLVCRLLLEKKKTKNKTHNTSNPCNLTA